MHTLYLLRHAKAAPETARIKDLNRPLNRRGRVACALLAEYFRDQHIQPALVLCSPSARTRETLRRIEQGLDRKLTTRFPGQLYLAEAETWLQALRRLDDGLGSVLLVGHNPGIESLAHLLSGGGDSGALRRMAERFPTGALATLKIRRGHWHDLAPGTARLSDFTTPKAIEV